MTCNGTAAEPALCEAVEKSYRSHVEEQPDYLFKIKTRCECLIIIAKFEVNTAVMLKDSGLLGSDALSTGDFLKNCSASETSGNY